MKAAFLLILSCGMAICFAEYDAPTAEEVEEVKQYVKDCFQSQEGCPGSSGIRNSAIRLTFHDCVGGKCDGCINLENDSNNGLTDVIEGLDLLYLDETYAINDIMSRADYWQLAGIAGIEMAIAISNRKCSDDDVSCEMPDPDITFYWGRDDCATLPYTTDEHEFPDPTMSRTEMMDYFSEHFGMDETEVTALMGAHSLGRADRQNSGYSGTWTTDAGQLFNNEYYQLLINTDLTFNNVANVKNIRTSTTDAKWQWELFDSDNEQVGFMINTDIELVADIDVDALEGTSCTLFGDCTAANTYATVLEYATDTTAFMDAFRAVYEKMGMTGYDDLVAVE